MFSNSMNKLAKERCSVEKKKKKNTVNRYYNIKWEITYVICGCQIQLYSLSK